MPSHKKPMEGTQEVVFDFKELSIDWGHQT